MEVVIRQLAAQGFRRITLAVGYLSELITAYFQDGSRWGVNISIPMSRSRWAPQGPSPDRRPDRDVPGNERRYSDRSRFSRLIDHHRSEGNIATIGAYEREVKIDLGVIIPNGRSRVQDYLEKPTSTHLVSMGVYIFEPEVVYCIGGPRYLDFPDLVKRLLDAGSRRCIINSRGTGWISAATKTITGPARNSWKKSQNYFIKT